MTTITIQKKATVNANGSPRNGNAKPVFNLTTGEIYSSVTDAAEALHSQVGNVSSCCNGNKKHIKGNKLCFVKELPSHLNELSTTIAECSDIIAEREAEKHRQMEMKKRQENIAKLKKIRDAQKERYNKMQEKANLALHQMSVTESRIEQLESAPLC